MTTAGFQHGIGTSPNSISGPGAKLAGEPQAQPSPSPNDLATPPPRHPVASTATLLAAVASPGLLLLCYFPVSCGWLAWVALVPFLVLVRSSLPARRVYLFAWLSGLLFFWPALEWLRVADPRMYFTWGALATYCSLFFPLAVLLIRRLDHRIRLPLVVTLPVVWTALEFFREEFGTGFAYYFLSHTQHAFLPLIQVSDVAGAYGVTFLVAAVNALLFECLYTGSWFRHAFSLGAAPVGRLPLRGQVAGVLVVAVSVLGYGFWRLGQNQFTEGPRLALIQGNVDQEIRNGATLAQEEEAAGMVLRQFVGLSDRAAGQRPKPDLIVWPETSYPDDWVELAPNFPMGRINPEKLKAINANALAYARGWGTTVLYGLNSVIYETPEPPPAPCRYNSAILIRPDGQAVARYDKIHRVPFGEYVPLRDWLPFLNRLAPYDFDYSVRAGENLTRFPLRTPSGNYSFGVIICFEDTDPVLARQYVKSQNGVPAVDFLVNISNDGWFKGTREHEEHLAICRFRAIESRRAVARAVNMGISAVIDGNGRIVALPESTWARSKKIDAVLTATVPIDRRTSLYALWGDWLPWSCWAVVGLGLLLSFGVSPRGRLGTHSKSSQQIGKSNHQGVGRVPP